MSMKHFEHTFFSPHFASKVTGVPWLLVPRDAFQMTRRCLLHASRMPPRCLPYVSHMPPGCCLGSRAGVVNNVFMFQLVSLLFPKQACLCILSKQPSFSTFYLTLFLFSTWCGLPFFPFWFSIIWLDCLPLFVCLRYLLQRIPFRFRLSEARHFKFSYVYI